MNRKEPAYIPDDCVYSPDDFVIPKHYGNDICNILLPQGMIMDRIEKLAPDIREHYGDTTIHLVCVLKGARQFFSALCTALAKMGNSRLPYVEHFVQIKRVIEDGVEVQMTMDDLSELANEHVLVVDTGKRRYTVLEDVVGDARQLSRLCKDLLKVKLASLRIATLFEKRMNDKVRLNSDFVGFSIPDAFVAGFGLDEDQKYRDCQHLVVVKR